MVKANRIVIDTSADMFSQPTPSPPPVPQPPEPNRANALAALSPGQGPRATVYSPLDGSLSRIARRNNPLFDPLQTMRGKWSDRQQVGRLTYDSMYKHIAVSAPHNTKVAFLKSYRPVFKPTGKDPTELQRQLADFANEQLRRLGSSGDPRQGYEKFVEWIGQGLKYGFALAEMSTKFAPWQGQRRIQIDRIYPLPQSSLDNGYTPHEDLGQIPTGGDVHYRCFDLDEHGRILAINQFFGQTGNTQEQIEWSGPDLLRILHFAHRGSEGNPFGESDFFTAFYHWGSLYTLEQLEEAMMDAGLPYMTASYKTPDGRPSPALHAQFLQTISEQDPALRALIMPDTTFGNTSPSNAAWVEHATRKKAELRTYIRHSIFGADLVDSASGQQLDARNVIDVFFKWILPSLQGEIGNLLQWQFARRLIDCNWSGLADTDYPTVEFGNLQANDLRVALPILQQILPFVDSSRLGEMLESIIPGFDKEWMPTDNKDSVQVMRGTPDPAAGGKTMPTKPPGIPDTQYTGNSAEEIGKQVDTAA